MADKSPEFKPQPSSLAGLCDLGPVTRASVSSTAKWLLLKKKKKSISTQGPWED